jgi:hypothetical protein
MIARKFNSFYAKEHKCIGYHCRHNRMHNVKDYKINNYSRKNEKITKREMNRSKQINNTNTKER